MCELRPLLCNISHLTTPIAVLTEQTSNCNSRLLRVKMHISLSLSLHIIYSAHSSYSLSKHSHTHTASQKTKKINGRLYNIYYHTIKALRNLTRKESQSNKIPQHNSLCTERRQNLHFPKKQKDNFIHCRQFSHWGCCTLAVRIQQAVSFPSPRAGSEGCELRGLVVVK